MADLDAVVFDGSLLALALLGEGLLRHLDDFGPDGITFDPTGDAGGADGIAGDVRGVEGDLLAHAPGVAGVDHPGDGGGAGHGGKAEG